MIKVDAAVANGKVNISLSCIKEELEAFFGKVFQFKLKGSILLAKSNI